ncbi:MAG: tetratricopeptide repeat protein [Candidatus Hydrogenedentota bacterium]
MKKISNQLHRVFDHPVRYLVFTVVVYCLVGFLIYSNTLHSPFVFDDKHFICENYTIKNIGNISEIWDCWATRFVTFVTFMINYYFHKLNVFGYHMVNILIHIGSAIMVYWFVWLTFSTPAIKKSQWVINKARISFMCGLLFLVHPIQTEAVTYIFQRSTSLATLFYLLALNLYNRARQISIENHALGQWLHYYLLSIIVTLTAMYTKEITGTIPIIIVLYEFYFYRESGKIRWKYLLFFIALILVIPLTLMMKKPVTFIDIERLSGKPVSSIHYLLTQFRVMITYFRLLLLPVNQNFEYDYPIIISIFNTTFLISFISVITIVITGVLLYHKNRIISFCILWFFIVLLPESSIIPLRDVIFEHRLYLPMVGYSLLLLTVATVIIKKVWIIRVFILLLIIGYATATYNRNIVWEDEVRLWDDVVAKSPKKASVYYGRGNMYLSKKKYEESLEDYNHSLSLDSGCVTIYINRSILYKTIKKTREALSDINRGLALYPYLGLAYNIRGNIYSEMEEYDKALADYNIALNLIPFYKPRIYLNRGLLYYKLKRYEEALADLNLACKFDPSHPEIYNGYGLVYMGMKEYDKALTNFNSALENDPNFKEAYFNRGYLYQTQKKTEKAIADFNKVLSIDSGLIEAYYNRGKVYSLIGEYDKAIADFNKIINLYIDTVSIYNEIGNNYYYKKEYNQAVVYFSKILSINPDSFEAYNNRGLAYYNMKKYDNAISDFTQSIKNNPQFAESYNNRGNAYYVTKNYARALADFNQAIELDSTLAKAYNNRGIIYCIGKAYDNALSDFNMAIKLDPLFYMAYYNRANVYHIKNEYTKAQQDRETAQQLFLRGGENLDERTN